jgi:hypothetical protein
MFVRVQVNGNAMFVCWNFEVENKSCLLINLLPTFLLGNYKIVVGSSVNETTLGLVEWGNIFYEKERTRCNAKHADLTT